MVERKRNEIKDAVGLDAQPTSSLEIHTIEQENGCWKCDLVSLKR